MEFIEYLVKTSRKLTQEHGLLPEVAYKSRERITEEDKAMIKQFYEDDEIGRMYPGMKDCVSVRNKEEHIIKNQKHLILYNLKEIYDHFKILKPDL